MKTIGMLAIIGLLADTLGLYSFFRKSDAALKSDVESLRKHFDERIKTPEELLADILARLQKNADDGDASAAQALADAREKHDYTRLDELLDEQVAELEPKVNDFIEPSLESAAVAYLRGDWDKAIARSESVLQLSPGNWGAMNQMAKVFASRGELDKAESIWSKLVEDNRNDESNISFAYGNLGLIHEARGDLDRAEEMLNKSLAIEEKLGRLEGMAANCGNLGLIYRNRGDLEAAEQMHKKSLAIEEKLGRLEGMAAQYGNLGLIYQDLGDLERAEEMFQKGLKIDLKLGRLEGQATEYGNLGLIYQDLGDLERAEEMHHKSLAIHEKLGRLEGMAANCGNLGSLYKQRGDNKKAKEFWTKSRDLFAQIGIPHKVAELQSLLDTLPPE